MQEYEWFSFKVGTSKHAIDPKLPSSLCVHFQNELQNQLCTYAEETVLETNFDPSKLLHTISKFHAIWCVGTFYYLPIRKYENWTNLIIINLG